MTAPQNLTRKILGYFTAFIFLSLTILILYRSFQKYELWTILYIPQACILFMYIYVFFPAFLLVIGRSSIKKMFVSSLPAEDTIKNFFTILIPAHNEDRLLPALLDSIRNQTFDKKYFQVLVIADNCNDHTAAVARQYGMNCLERFTTQPSDKQQALEYGMQNFTFEENFNKGYVCIIDADCHLNPDFLREMNQQLINNPEIVAMQSYRFVKNMHDSSVTVLDAAAEALRNWAFCAPRKWIGASVFINGSGILFTKKIFEKLVSLPGSNHLTEDKEWKAYLSERNLKVDYCPCAQLAYEAVSSQKDFQKQRKRWVGSHMNMMYKYGWIVLKQSILNLNFTQFDFFCSLMQLPRSLLLISSLFFAVLDFLYSPASFFPHWAWVAMIGAMILYGFLGLYLIKARANEYMAIPHALSMVTGVFKTTFLSLIGKSTSQWKPTRVENEEH